MIKVAFYIFFAVFMILVIRRKTDFVFLIPIFNIIADASFTYFEGFSAPTFLRAITLTIFLYYSYSYYKRQAIRVPFYWFFIYIGILLLLSSEFSYSLKASYQVILSMAMFLGGYTLIDSFQRYEKLLRSLYWIIIVSVILTALGYIFGIGKELEYTNDDLYTGQAENVGLLGSGGLYTPAVILGLLPLIIKLRLNVLKKWMLYLFSFVLYVFILLNVRRTAISIPIVGVIGFLFYSKSRSKILRYVIVGGVCLMITFPLYSDKLIQRFNLRQEQGRFEEDFYKTEARYLENVEMVDAIAKFDEPMKVLFGVGNNIFAEHVENGEIVRRMFHSDPAKLFYGVGLFSIFLYLAIFFRLIHEILKIPARGILADLKSASLGLVLILLFISLNGSINLITFRSVTFLLLGAFLGFAHSIIKTDGRVLNE